MIRRIALVALFVLGGLIAPAVQAQSPVGTPRVVLIGIDKYQDPQIKPRRHAEADAKALYDLFLKKENLGVEKDHIKLLLGSASPDQRATRENILKALHWLENSAKKDDLVILAFFGNGAPLGERACYFSVDSTFKNRAKDALASGDIEAIIEKVKSQRFVALIDVNFFGFDSGKEKAPEPNLANFYKEFIGSGDEGKDPVSRVLFLAGPSTKPSLDLDKHGVFAQVLLDGLAGKADSLGYEGDGNITVGELAKFVRKTVPELTREYGKTKEQKEQKSGVIEGQTSDFVVGYNPSARLLALERLKKFEALVEQKKLDKTLAEEGNTLLTRMPKLEAQQSLRKAYQKLVDGKIDIARLEAERKEILDATQLTDEEANRFAVTVMNAAALVDKRYFKEVAMGPLVEHAIIGIYKHSEEKIPSDIKDRLGKVKDLKEAGLRQLLTDARQHLGKREDLAKGQDITYALNGLLGKLDRHTGYIPPEVVERFRSDLSGRFRGIGVQIRRSELLDQPQVITPIFNSPAHKAGLKANDVITTVISEADPLTGKAYDKPIVTPTKGMTIDEVVKLVKGKAGTKIKLQIQREGSDKPIEYTLIRNDIEVESVMGAKRDAKGTWSYVVDPENKICYVRLTQFSETTYEDLAKVMKQLRKDGIKGFILDLRFNPGGALDSSIKIADLFIDDGIIVTVRGRDGMHTSYVGRSDGSYTSFPMVCLINGGSASASEIVSACLQDHGRAVIMGSRSFGKGSVQTIHGFDNKSILKLTTATFWRPKSDPVSMRGNLNKASTQGREEDEWGVKPNAGFTLKLPRKEEDELFDHFRDTEIIRDQPSEAKTAFTDRQLDMALEYLRGQIQTAAGKKGNRDIENR